MAAKTPTAGNTTAVAADIDRSIPLFETATTAPIRCVFKEDLKHQCFYFANVDTADAWTSGIRGITSLAWTSESAGSVNAYVTNFTTGVIQLIGSAADESGWLHVWSRN
jgi:hypothetical protein